jgi:nucleoside-diphosphate-sugar epimerase
MDLVTGATGFVGPHLVAALVARGRRVRCLVRNGARTPALPASGVDVRQGSLLDRRWIAEALDGVDRVFHLAGGGRVSAMGEAGLAALREANVAPLEAVLAAATGAKLRSFVHFSSISAMGIQLGVPLDEETPCRPSTPHEIAKLESEGAALAAWSERGVPVVVIRPSQIYGPGDLRSEIPLLVRLARRGLVPLFGDGEGRVPWVFVSDVVDAAVAAAERPAASGRTYIVSDADSYRFADVVQSIAEALGRRRGGIPVPAALALPPIALAESVALALGRVPPFTVHRFRSICGQRLYSIDRARRELGYAPRVGLREGMARTVAFYVEQGLA